MPDDGDISVPGGLKCSLKNIKVKPDYSYLDVTVLNGGGDETRVIWDDFELNGFTDVVVALDVQRVAECTLFSC